MRAIFASLLLCLSVGSTGAASTPEETAADEVVIVAQRIEAPIWRVERDGKTLILVGAIQRIPKGFEWNAAALERAVGQSTRVLLPIEGRVSPVDLFKLAFKVRQVGMLPEGVEQADALGSEWAARLERLKAGERDTAWRRFSPFTLGFSLLREEAGGAGGGAGPAERARKAASANRIKARTVGIVRGDTIVDSVLARPQAEHAPCARAAIEAAEAGPAGAARRAELWRTRKVAETLATPLERAVNVCWPWGDPELGPQMVGLWRTAIDESLAGPGVTLAIAPLNLLASKDGVLDRLEADGYAISGPPWRPGGEGPT